MTRQFQGSTIVRFLDERRMTRQELADAVDVSRSTLYRWIVGQSEPSATQLRDLAAALNRNPMRFYDADA